MIIRGSRILAAGALVLSTGLHLGGVQALYLEEPTKIEGGAQASIAMLGNSFRDVTRGDLGKAPPEEIIEDVAPETTEETDPEPPLEPIEPEQIARPEAQPTNEVQKPQTTQAEPVETALVVPQQAMSAPIKATPLAPSAIPVQPSPQLMLKPVEVQPTAPISEPTVMAALPDSAQMALSTRPKLRPKTVEEEAAKRTPPAPKKKAQVKPKPKKKAQAKPKPKKKATQGTTQQQERKGVQGGQQGGKSTTTSKGKRRAKKPGNAAVSNYPGIVKRKIFRSRRPRASRKARATIAFKISGGGGISSIRVSRSSGNAKFDRDALNFIRRAAPFPKPPAGARRSYSITIDSR